MTRTLAVLALVMMTVAAAGGPKHRKIDMSKLGELEQRADHDKLCLAGNLEENRASCAQICEAGSALSCKRLGAWYAGGGESFFINTTFQDLDKAAVAFETACKLKYAPACYDLYLTDVQRHAKSPRGDLRALCDGGYALACEALAKTERDEKRRTDLLTKACRGGGRDSCLDLVSDDDLNGARELVGKAVDGVTVSSHVKLACPKGATAFRSIDVYPSALGTVRPKWSCGAIDLATHRFVAEGPYIQYPTEEDEVIAPNGLVSERGTMKHGKREGIIKKFEEHGALHNWTTFHDGKEDGVEYVLAWEFDEFQGYNRLIDVERIMWNQGKRGESVTERVD